MNCLSEDSTPIIALCTPEGTGALAVLRLSGEGLFGQDFPWVKIFNYRSFEECPTQTIHYGFVADPLTQQKIDQVLFLVMKAPKSFTGQDTLEISCHNNKHIINKIISLACCYGARLARPGEFSRRAVLNNKIDLLQAEAIHELIAAQTEQTALRALQQVTGSLSQALAIFEQELVQLIAFVEAAFEFLDEEQRDLAFHEQVEKKIKAFKEKIDELRASFHDYEALQRGIRIAILGPTNAGKSTLFNALIKKERSIVTSIAGTTRDSIEAPLYKANMTMHLIDTAGLRETEDIIEQEGIVRSCGEARQADLLLIVLDSQRSLYEQLSEKYQSFIQSQKERAVIIFNKVDCAAPHQTLIDYFSSLQCLSLSAKEKIGTRELEELIEKKAEAVQSKQTSPYQLTRRQWLVFTDCSQKIDTILSLLSAQSDLEIIAYELRETLMILSQLSGKESSEKILDQVFGSFCIGK